MYALVPGPAAPPVSVLRVHDGSGHPAEASPHAHDFPGLFYVVQGGGTLRSGGRERPLEDGDLYVVAPGDVMEPRGPGGFGPVQAIAVFFTQDALDRERSDALLSWWTHPLLFPFVRGSGMARGALRLRVPEDERAAWLDRLTTLETELVQRRDGYRHAALAHLVLLLVGVARLAGDVVGDLRRNDERLLADVFGVIERRYPERLSLRDVARELSLTPGHLTTEVRRRTGRTVQDWITERRLTEARRMLVETDLPVAEVARRAGYPDPGYFARTFRRQHGTSPRDWRTAQHP